jgi:hypothetical protein
MVIDWVSMTATANPTLTSDAGVYTVTISASIPATAITPNTVSTSFTLTVYDECTSTSLVDRTLVDMIVQVSETANQDITFTDS